MWTIFSGLFTKTGLIIVAAVATMILVGVLLLKNQSLKSTIAEKQTLIVSLEAQLVDAKQAIEGYKGAIDGKNAEIAGCQEQVKIGDEAIKEYKESIDKLLFVTKDWKSIAPEKRREILDEKSNAEAVRLLNNALPSDRVRKTSPDSGVLPPVFKTKKVR